MKGKQRALWAVRDVLNRTPSMKSLVSVLSELMKKLKFEISMDVEDSFVDDAKRLEHHADGLLDLDSYLNFNGRKLNTKILPAEICR